MEITLTKSEIFYLIENIKEIMDTEILDIFLEYTQDSVYLDEDCHNYNYLDEYLDI